MNFNSSEDFINDVTDFKNLLKEDPKLLLQFIDQGFPEKYRRVLNTLSTNRDFKNIFDLYRKTIVEVNLVFSIKYNIYINILTYKCYFIIRILCLF